MRYSKKMFALWSEYVVDGLCGLCGNSGIVDTTTTVKSPRGQKCGIKTECICPNGRCLRKGRSKSESKSVP